MPQPDFVIRQNDVGDLIEAVLVDSTGVAVDLTDATVVFQLAPIRGGALVVSADADLGDDDGAVSYTWQDGDTAAAGWYLASWRVTFDGGAIQSFPLGAYTLVQVIGELGLIPEAGPGNTGSPLLGHGSPQGTNAIKYLRGGEALSGGDWTLAYQGQTTDPLAFDADAAAVQAALETLASLLDPQATVHVTGGPLAYNGDDGGFSVEFRFQLGAQPIPAGDFTIDASGLVGGTAAITDHAAGVLPLPAGNGLVYVDTDAGAIYLMVAGNWWQTYPTLKPYGVNEIDDGIGFAIIGGDGAGGGDVRLEGGRSAYDNSLGTATLAGGSTDRANTGGKYAQITGGVGGDGTGAAAFMTAEGGKPDGRPGALSLSQRVNVANLPTEDPEIAGDVWNSAGALKVSAG